MRFDPVAPGSYPELLHAAYKSTRLRGPQALPLRVHAPAAAEHGMRFAPTLLGPHDADLTVHGRGAPLGEKIVVTGRVSDEDGRPVRNSLVEVWQCNAAGRYWHKKDRHDAPLDPNFHGLGKFFTDAEGRYRFVSIKPGPYPWGNQDKAWRPAHIHFSLFGNVLAQRLVTQMYFAGDPLFDYDPIYQSIPDPAARLRLSAHLDMDETVGAEMLGYRFDIVLRGRGATPFGL
ncbi:protocatechuate 3,4-dioxygenase subunit beta [Rivibacter subsaxonicus]|uniref:Protocatechuate 3,4-dioxygenase beta subunit n=1 Tax=Rivibacter subsaxonicus TaxID=457575 RepID=A0A4Q7VVV2_9BURK|nr:protocatechuate 3,4-dioxygenase subunit beta [Rivibacter subsaxonicus]RZU00723.1 protocatechuate 3,4-dioxygenase beta subunit [Rivibacter subsaxonicus]